MFRYLTGILFYLVLYIPQATAQECAYDTTQQIIAFDATSVFIDVSGLDQSTLGTNQFLCRVELHFSHPRIEHLRMELISPAGQSISLVGPGTVNSIVTDLMSWEVNFVQCSAIASPDLGFDQMWNSNQSWQILNTYDGFYFPFAGCLEDFNLGSANGRWELRITNLGMQTSGVLDYFELIFCDPTGINCETCAVSAANLEYQQLVLCYDPSPDDFLFDFELTAMPFFDEDLFDQLYVFYDGDQTIKGEQIPNISDLLPGTYQMCNVILPQNFTDTYSLFDLGRAGLENLLLSTDICGDFSTQCIDITIYDTNPAPMIQALICQNDSFDFNGINLFAPLDTVIYDFDVDNLTCLETQIILEQSNIEANLSLSGQLECGSGTVIANGLMSIGDNLQYTWNTTNGNFLSAVGPIAQIDQIGDYQLIIDDMICSDTLDFSIADSGSSFDLSLQSNPLLCGNDTTSIVTSTSVTLDSFIWNGPGIVDPDELNPMVFMIGEYTIQAFSNGCSVIQSITVTQDDQIPSLSTTVSNIDCNAVFGCVEIVTDLVTYDFVVIGTNDFVFQNDKLQINEGGNFSIQIFDPSNPSCFAQEDFSIAVDTIAPLININQAVSLPCTGEAAKLFLIDPIPNTTVTWSSNQNFNVINDTLFTLEEGGYNLSVSSDENGCSSTALINVAASNSSLGVDIEDAFINCTDSFPQICASITSPFDLIEWSFEDQIIGNQDCIISQGEGWYVVSVLDGDGCTATDSFLLSSIGVEPLIVAADVYEMSCENGITLIDITGSDIASNFDINWSKLSGEGQLISTDQNFNLTVDGPGIFLLEIFNNLNQCMASKVMEVVPNPNQIEGVFFTSFDESCFGANDGQLTDLMAFGGTNLIQQVLDEDGAIVSDLNNLSPGVYTIDFINDENCTKDTSFQIEPGMSPILTIADTINILAGQSLTLMPETDQDTNSLSSILWESNQDILCVSCFHTNVTPAQPANYTITILDQNGCAQSTSVFINFDLEEEVYTPSVFSPEGENPNNQYFGFKTAEGITAIQNFEIYDRWGNLVFIAENMPPDDPNAQWDGRFRNQNCSVGVYVFKVSFITRSGQEKILKGNLTLLR